MKTLVAIFLTIMIVYGIVNIIKIINEMKTKKGHRYKIK